MRLEHIEQHCVVVSFLSAVQEQLLELRFNLLGSEFPDVSNELKDVLLVRFKPFEALVNYFMFGFVRHVCVGRLG